MTGLLHLVRHGETTANVARVLDTLPPGAPLTPEGVQQARRFAANRTPARATLFCSVARRAQQTAEIIATQWDQSYKVIDEVHEVQAGDLEGRSDEASVEAFKDVVRRWYTGDLRAAPPGGESAEQLIARYLPVVAELRAQHLDTGDVYLVSHGAAIRLVAATLAAVDGEYAQRHHLPNTGEVVLRPTADGWALVSWADAPAPVDPMG